MRGGKRGSWLALGAVLTVSFALAARAEDEKDQERKIEAGHVKKGQLYRFKLAGGNACVWEIVDRTETEVSYKIRLTAQGKEQPATEAYRFPLRRKVKKDDEKKGNSRPAEETLEISGVKFPCVILESEAGGTTIKTWQSTLFPEGVKTQVGKDVTLELVEIKQP